MTYSPTVLAVGGGATGMGIARNLALRGVDATLVERNGLASGARYAEANRVGAEE